MPELLPEIENDFDQEEDETIVERLWGLTEMFPDFVRNSSSSAAGYMVTGSGKLYRFVRSALWAGTTGFIILAVPIVFEQERFNLEQQQQQHQRQILLGPNAAVSNMPGGGMGMAPPPPPK